VLAGGHALWALQEGEVGAVPAWFLWLSTLSLAWVPAILVLTAQVTAVRLCRDSDVVCPPAADKVRRSPHVWPGNQQPSGVRMELWACWLWAPRDPNCATVLLFFLFFQYWQAML